MNIARSNFAANAQKERARSFVHLDPRARLQPYFRLSERTVKMSAKSQRRVTRAAKHESLRL